MRVEFILSDFKLLGIIRGGYSLLSLIKSNLILLSNFLFLNELLNEFSKFCLLVIDGNCEEF